MQLGEYKDYLPTPATQTTTLVRGENTMVFEYAKLDDIKYTVEYKLPDGSIVNELTQKDVPAAARMQVVGISQEAATWASDNGYMFKNGTTQVVSDMGLGKVVTFDLDYQPYTITYVLGNGETWENDFYTKNDLEISISKQPTWEGHRFVGWKVDGVDTKVEQIISKDPSTDLLPPESLGQTITLAKGTIGDLTIEALWQIDVVVTAPSKTMTYDGTNIMVAGGWTDATATNLLPGHKVVISSDAIKLSDGSSEMINAGEKLTTLDKSDVKIYWSGVDVTRLYNITEIKNGLAKIGQREVTVTGEGWPSEQPYTGKPYTKDGEYAFDNVVAARRPPSATSSRAPRWATTTARSATTSRSWPAPTT